jgi:hypothetical protein
MIGPLSSRPTIITNKRELNPKEIAARIIKVAQSLYRQDREAQ